MNGNTHIMIGAAVGLTLGTQYPLESAIIIVTSSVMGALLPDIDHPKSLLNQRILPVKNTLYKKIVYMAIGMGIFYFGWSTGRLLFKLLGITLGLTGMSHHRGFTHSLLGLLMYTYIVKLVTVQYDVEMIYIGFVAGYISHLVSDFFTKGGIELFYPLGDNVSAPFVIKSEGFWENVIVKCSGLYSMYVLWQHISI